MTENPIDAIGRRYIDGNLMHVEKYARQMTLLCEPGTRAQDIKQLLVMYAADTDGRGYPGGLRAWMNDCVDEEGEKEGVFYVARSLLAGQVAWSTCWCSRAATAAELSRELQTRNEDVKNLEIKLELKCTVDESEALLGYIKGLSSTASGAAYEAAIERVKSEGLDWLDSMVGLVKAARRAGAPPGTLTFVERTDAPGPKRVRKTANRRRRPKRQITAPKGGAR